MPTYNSIQTDRLENFIRRFLSVRNGGILPTVTPELGIEVTVPQLEDAMGLAGYIPWGAASWIPAGGAGTFGAVSFFNATPAQLMVLEFTAGCGGVANLTLSAGPALGLGLLAAGRAGWRDMRRAQGSFPLNVAGVQLQEGTLGAVPPGAHTLLATVRRATDVSWTMPPVVVPPGQGAAVWLDVANLAMSWSIKGYMRDMVADEDTI